VAEEEHNGIQIIRVPLFPDQSRSFVKRALNFLSFPVSVGLLGLWLSPRPDVVHVCHPVTVGLPAILLCSWWRIRFTMEIQDMWPETLRSTGMLSNKRLLRMIGAISVWVYSRAACVRVISPGFRINLLDKGVEDAKIKVISNWVDTDYYRRWLPTRRLPRSSASRIALMFFSRFAWAWRRAWIVRVNPV